MKKILFISRGSGGVNYYRIQTPLIALKKYYPNDFIYDYHVDVDYRIEENYNKLFDFNIIVYNKTILPKEEDNTKLLLALKEKNIKIAMDIDDYWELDKTHFAYENAKKTNDKSLILSNIINADIVTTTTENFKKEIEKFNKFVYVLENSIDPEIMPQFKNNWVKGDRVAITYLGGSAHLTDIGLLQGTFNLLFSDNDLKDKFYIINAGFDKRGTKLKREINDEFFKVLEYLFLPKDEILKSLILNNFDISKITQLPDEIKNLFKDKLIKYKEVDIEPKESPYYQYEKIFTDNYKTIDKQYYLFLHNFKNEKYHEINVPYVRKWATPVNQYANILNETDIVLAPLVDTPFNNMKSNLKMVEASSRKLPIICSDVKPYNTDGKHMHNCILVKEKKNSYRDWYKAMKRLILSEELRQELGNNLHNDISFKYSLEHVTDKRFDLLNNISLHSI